MSKKLIISMSLVTILGFAIFYPWSYFSFSKSIDQAYRACLEDPRVMVKWQDRNSKIWIRPIDEPNIYAQCG